MALKTNGLMMNDMPKEDRPIEDMLDTSETVNVEAPNSAEGEFEVLKRLMAENEELKDRALRIAAEMENLRRRTARDVQDARAYAVSNFARDMLAVSDNLRRALDAIPTDAEAVADTGLKALAEGVEMTERAMLSTLERHGVKKLAPEGEKFDPNFHQAMFEIPNPTVPASTVLQVVQPGYSIGDRVLRPAMVGVSTGGPKHAPANDSKPEPGPVNGQASDDA